MQPPIGLIACSMALRDRTGARLWLTAVAVLTGLAVVLVSTALILDRDRSLARSQAQLKSLVALLQDHGDRAIEEGNKIIRAIQPDVAGWDLHNRAKAEALFTKVHQLVQGSPQIASLWIMDRAGLSVFDSWGMPARPIRAPEREYFQRALKGDHGPIIAPIADGAISKRPRFTISRGVWGPRGSLHAVITVGVFSSYFQQLYSEALKEPSMRAGLFIEGDPAHPAGGVLARLGNPNRASKKYLTKLEELMRSSKSGADEINEADGAQRVAAWQRSDQFPHMFASASQSISSALADWRTQAIQLVTVTILAIGAFAALTYVLIGYFRAQARASRNELLVREVHHRVRNNLQILLGLVQMRAAAAPDVTTRNAIAGIGGDLAAFGEAFELLRGSAEEGMIDVTELLRGLCENLAKALGRPIDFTTDGPIWLESDAAINTAIIANELITNCVKYSRATPKVLCLADQGSLRLHVIGGDTIDPELLSAENSGFGLRMAKRLASEAGGEISVLPPKCGATGIEVKIGRKPKRSRLVGVKSTVRGAAA